MDDRIALTFLLLLTSCTIETVNSDYKGLLIDNRENHASSKEVLQPGKHLIPVYDDLVLIRIAPTDYNDEFDCLTKDEKLIRVFTTVQYHPISEEIAQLYTSWGNNFFDYFIVPEFRATIRNTFKKYDSLNLNKAEIETLAIHGLDSVYKKGHIAIKNFNVDWGN
jgi:regulator of protease activity HflC (stomatin/prohibitin superfamily)